MSEMKTEDIIKSLRVCGDGICSPRCVMNCFASECHSKCRNNLALLAADRLEHSANAGKMAPDDERIMQQAIETYGVQAQCDRMVCTDTVLHAEYLHGIHCRTNVRRNKED